MIFPVPCILFKACAVYLRGNNPPWKKTDVKNSTPNQKLHSTLNPKKLPPTITSHHPFTEK